MAKESRLMRKLIIAKEVLDEIPLKDEYYSAGLIRKGKLIEITTVGNCPNNLNDLARMIEPLTSSGNNVIEPPNDIRIRYPQKKVVFKCLEVENEDNPFWLWVCMELTAMYFNRFFNKILARLRILLY